MKARRGVVPELLAGVLVGLTIHELVSETPNLTQKDAELPLTNWQNWVPTETSSPAITPKHGTPYSLHRKRGSKLWIIQLHASPAARR